MRGSDLVIDQTPAVFRGLGQVSLPCARVPGLTIHRAHRIQQFVLHRLSFPPEDKRLL